MIHVHIEDGDFGREMRVTIIETNGENDSILFPNGEGSIIREPIMEGERVPPNRVVRLPMMIGREILQGLVVELARLGYITHDPNGTRLKEQERHLDTLTEENVWKRDTITKLIGKK